MTSSIDPNLPAATGAVSGTSDQRIDGIDGTGSSGLNIPNDDANYHWFLTENTGSRTTISPSDRINADMAVNSIASLILSHIRS